MTDKPYYIVITAADDSALAVAVNEARESGYICTGGITIQHGNYDHAENIGALYPAQYLQAMILKERN